MEEDVWEWMGDFEMTTNWKKRAEELEAEVRRVRAYAFDYGNATGECESGYLQQDGYICHRCNTDDYRKGCPRKAASRKVSMQDNPKPRSGVGTSPLPTTLEELEALKQIAWGEGYAVGCLAEKALRTALADLVEIERRDQLTNPDRAATDEWRAKSWANARAALSTSNDSGARQ